MHSMTLDDIVKKRLLFIGIGNRQRGDDGAGPVLIDKLHAAGFTNILDAGIVPENYTRRIICYCPDVIIFIDALHFGSNPGCWKLCAIDTCSEHGFSTHTVSLTLITSYIRFYIPATILLLGIQPATTGFQPDLSNDVQKSVDQIVDKLKYFSRYSV